MEKPKIKLTPLEETAIEVPTQEKSEKLRRVVECGGWVWSDNSLPTHFSYWERYREETCIGAGTSSRTNEKGKFGFCSKDLYLAKRWKTISDENFYEIQNVTLKKQDEINAYFDNLKKNPSSK